MYKSYGEPNTTIKNTFHHVFICSFVHSVMHACIHSSVFTEQLLWARPMLSPKDGEVNKTYLLASC